jgi:hypothetical protein
MPPGQEGTADTLICLCLPSQIVFNPSTNLSIFIHSLNIHSLALLYIMANTAGPQGAPPQDEDEITFVPPTTEHIPVRPGLPRQTAEVVAKDASVPNKPDPPSTPPMSSAGPPIGSFQFVSFDGVHDAAPPGTKRGWKRIKLYACFWKYKRIRQSSPELENDGFANNSRADGFWKRVRGYFSNTASPTPDTAGRETTDDPVTNETVKPTKPGAPDNPVDSDNSRESFEARLKRILMEVNGFLQNHRRKFTRGHEGQLRGLLMCPL